MSPSFDDLDDFQDRRRRPRPEAADRIPHLQLARVARFNWRTLFTSPRFTLGECVALDTYFRRFAQPSENRCLGCDGQLGATGLMDAYLGIAGFTWGIAHGEGICRACGYPARALHYNVGPIERVSVILQYHPDDLTVTVSGREDDPR